MYQAVLLALLFLGWSLCHSAWKSAIIFAVFAAAQFYTALRIDEEYENEELVLVKGLEAELDKAAEKLGFHRAHGHNGLQHAR